MRYKVAVTRLQREKTCEHEPCAHRLGVVGRYGISFEKQFGDAVFPRFSYFVAKNSRVRGRFSADAQMLKAIFLLPASYGPLRKAYFDLLLSYSCISVLHW